MSGSAGGTCTPGSFRGTGPASVSRGSIPRDLPVLGLYLLVAVMFCGLYFQTTHVWSADNLATYTFSSGRHPFEGSLIRYRVLMPLLARGLTSAFGIDLKLVYCGLATLSVFALLIAYRSYLSNFLRPGFATLMCLGIIYPLIWNFCLLNNIYFPFDLPSVLFFTLGCHYIYRRKWKVYYPLFVLAVFNRETSCFLVFVVLFGLFREMRSRRLLGHIAAHAALWIGLKSLLYFLIGEDPQVFSTCRLALNTRVASDVLAVTGNGPKDLAKLLLAFGGTWLAVPWLYRSLPRFPRRCLLTVIPFLAVVVFMSIIDEVRCYGELIPVIITPVVYAAARELGGTLRRDPDSAC